MTGRLEEETGGHGDQSRGGKERVDGDQGRATGHQGPLRMMAVPLELAGRQGRISCRRAT